MRKSNTLIFLCALIAILALIAAASGLLTHDNGRVYTVTSLRGQAVQIYGQGLYRYDTFLIGAGNRGTDAAVLFVEIPLLIVAALLYRRGSLRGGLLLTGSLGCFLYYYASMALVTAYNALFLLYVALFGISLYAFILAFTSVDLATLPNRFSARFPRRGFVAYLFAIAVLLLIVWLGLSLLPALLAGQIPVELATYTTLATYALDLAIIVPAAFIAAALLARRRPLGYLLAAFITILNVTIGLLLIGQGAAQLLLRVPLPIGAILGFMVSFAISTVVALCLTVVLFRNVAGSGAVESA